MIDFKCPKCGEAMSVPDSLAGRTETCPECGNVAVVPERDSVPVAELVPDAGPRFTAGQSEGAELARLVASTKPKPTAAKPVARKGNRKQCPQCKEWINRGATKCPHCQSTQPPPAWAVLMAVPIVLGLGLWAYRSCSSVTDSPEARRAAAREEQYGSKLTAWAMAQSFVEDRLVSPSSADFGWQSYDECVTDLGEGLYVAEGWVDSENRFGAKIRGHFMCRLKYVGNENWRCESLDIRER